jgi:serine/threonine-protein kinase
MPLADGSMFAGYTIVRLLGAGGMGEVYLAKHPRLPREDALKVLSASVTEDAEYRQRFEREADIAATLWHPHIVGVHDRGEYDDRLWIAMDYVSGTDAANLLKRYPHGLPQREVLDIVTAVAEALDYAHERHLLHRDVKPANILLSDPEAGEQRIMLADFGIARRDDDVSGLTATNTTVGTVSYAAPEQLMGGAIDGRTDQYALAATAYHLLTGSPPFQHSNPAVVISQHLSAAPPKLGLRRPELANLDPALAKALAKNPDDRYARCVDFAHALGNQVSTPPSGDFGTKSDATRLAPITETTPSDGSPAAAKPPRAHRSPVRPGILIPAIIVLLLVVAGVAIAATMFTNDEEQRKTAPVTDTVTVEPAAPPSTSTLPPTTTPPPSTTTDTVTETAAATPTATAPAPTAVVGARCASPGATGTTVDGATAYCSNLQYTVRYLWSLNPGEIPNPVLTSSPTVAPPSEDESPVRICVQQTGHSRLRCAEEILRGNQP